VHDDARGSEAKFDNDHVLYAGRIPKQSVNTGGVSFSSQIGSLFCNYK
jgi:hypothetical protein